MTLSMPYSDNAGFLAQGVPAVAITFLPKDEATLYYKSLMSEKNLSKAVLNCDNGFRSKNETDVQIELMKYKEMIPFTWRLFHTEMDNYLSLTEETFGLMEKILDEIALMRTFA